MRWLSSGYCRVEASGVSDRDGVGHRPLHGGLAAQFFAGQAADPDHELVLVLDLAQAVHCGVGKISAMTAPLTPSPEPVR